MLTSLSLDIFQSNDTFFGLFPRTFQGLLKVLRMVLKYIFVHIIADLVSAGFDDHDFALYGFSTAMISKGIRLIWDQETDWKLNGVSVPGSMAAVSALVRWGGGGEPRRR